jgi:hypothetical protein
MQTSAVLGDRSNNQHQEVIEVQILPQVKKKKTFSVVLLFKFLNIFNEIQIFPRYFCLWNINGAVDRFPLHRKVFRVNRNI